jgi:TatD DNase family protein
MRRTCPGLAQRPEALSYHSKVVAIGKLALTTSMTALPATCSRTSSALKLALALKRGKPVIVHDREAHHDCLRRCAHIPMSPGSTTVIPAAWRMPRPWWAWAGCSPSPIGHLPERPVERWMVIKWMPMEHIMIETDSPYLTPDPCGAGATIRLCPPGGRGHRRGQRDVGGGRGGSTMENASDLS